MQPLQPTLWRTCRVLANRQRLRLLSLLIQTPNQCVSEVARRARLPVAVVSQYLRALNARGLLDVTRRSRWVRYRLAVGSAEATYAGLLRELRNLFKKSPDPVEHIFHVATAFTHPRRIDILRSIQKASHTPTELQRLLHISLPALNRHLHKLERRGFACLRDGIWVPCSPSDPVAKVLLDLVIRD